ncbi:4Fe-4S binding protein [Elusimicrobiota bacterium]
MSEDTATKKLAVVDKETCAGCEACVPECPNEAITIDEEMAIVDAEKCDGCGTCVESCPTESLKLEDR